jgi:hypothetical protein
MNHISKKICFFIALIIVFNIPSRVHGEDLVHTYEVNKGKIAISKNRITLIDSSGKQIDAYNPAPWEIKDACLAPPKEHLFVILGQKGAPRGERLALFSVSEGKIKKEWIGEDRGYNPWKIMAKDVDGDGRVEICVGVWKKTRFHPVFDNRLFIYDWDGEQLFPKWLGSRLSLPYLDFDFRDIDGDGVNELIALEVQKNGLKRIMSYKWSGFGFAGFEVLKEDLEAENLSQVKIEKRAGK